MLSCSDSICTSFGMEEHTDNCDHDNDVWSVREQTHMTTHGARVSLVVPRLDSKPWGGRKLANYGMELPPDSPIGEALLTAGEAVIAAGYGEGSTLQAIVDEDPRGRLGERAHQAVAGRNIFPLLVKLIHAAENLSIQVHPDDDGARPLDRLGKTEAWYVLDASPGAKLYLGLREDVDVETFITSSRKLDGSSESALRAIEAQPGMTVLIPAGTIHALGAGVIVYEIQQPSDVTFRLDDWGRVDAQGNPREMHLTQGYEAARPAFRPSRIRPIDLSASGVRRQILTACRYFALEHLQFPAGTSVQFGGAGSPQVLTPLSGNGRLKGADDVELRRGVSAVIWPTSAPAIFTAVEPCELLRAWVPDLVQEVIGPARVAGAGDVSIAELGGASADLSDALSS